MILHIAFIDGSNPWITYGDAAHCLKAWRKWEKNQDARPLFIGGGLKCARLAGVGGWAVAKYFDGAHKRKDYQRLGNALKYMEKQGA